MISVALCTFDGAPYLEQQLRSILDGSARPDEIVLVDDGSRDGTVDIARRVLAGARDVRSRVERNASPLGVTANFARALGLTSGELIVLSDQDDLWHPAHLARIADDFASRPELLLRHTDARLVDGAGAPLGATLFERLGVGDAERRGAVDDPFATYLRRNLATGATTALRRELLHRAEPFPAEWVHDEWLAILAAADGPGAVLLVDAAEIDYRQHGANQIGVADPTLRRKVARALSRDPGRNAALSERARILLQRLESMSADGRVLSAARGKQSFETARAAMPRMRALRVPAILRLLAAGGYPAYASQGLADVLRDLLQPR